MQQNSSAQADNTRTWGFTTAGRVFFGSGVVRELRSVSEEFGRKVLVCTDANIVKSGICDKVVSVLKEGGSDVTVFDGGKPEVDVETIDVATAAARKASPDVIVGLGGGSNLDLSKAVAIRVNHDGSIQTFYGENNVPGPIANLVAIPTTSGTGSEVSPVAVITDPEKTMKIGIASRHIIPRWAIVDPLLTLSCPVSVSSHSGMDALTHAIEAYCAHVPVERSPRAIFVGKNPVSDALARQAIQLVSGSLRSVVKEPSNRAAREDMALASLLAGMSFSCAGTAAVHALQYPVGEATHTPHGLGNAVLLPTVMRAIRKSRIPEMAFIARCFDASLASVPDETAADQAPELVEKFSHEVGIPKGLGALGLKREQLPDVAKLAETVKRLLDNSPVPFDQKGLLGLLEEAY